MRSHRPRDRARRQKINLQRLLAYLCVKIFQVRASRLFLGGRCKYANRILQQLLLPLRNLVRMNVKLFRQGGKGLIAFEGGYRHFRLERGCVITAGSSHCSLLLLVGDFRRLLKQKYHLSDCPNFRGYLS